MVCGYLVGIGYDHANTSRERELKQQQRACKLPPIDDACLVNALLK
jgi:hypothetical protein